MRDLLVLDALMTWRDSILQKDTLRTTKIWYLSNMSKLIELGLFDLEQPLTELLKTRPEEKLRAIDENPAWAQSTKEDRRTALRAFYRFAQEEKIKPFDLIIPFPKYRDIHKVIISELFSSNKDKAESQSLETSDIIRFLRELCSTNPRDALICWLLWEIKATVHQVLDLLVGNIDFDKGVIHLKNESRLGDIRPDLKQYLKEQIKGKSASDLVFTTAQGRRIHAGQISRAMKIASKRANLPIIVTPKILYAHSKAYGAKAYQDMSEEDREKLLQYYEKKLNVCL